MIAAEELVELARRHVLGEGETIEWMKAFPDGPSVHLDAGHKAFKIKVLEGVLRVEEEPWVRAVVAASREDQDLEGPPPRQYFLLRDDGVVRLGDAGEVAALGPLLPAGRLHPVAYMELLMEGQWPGGWSKRLILDMDFWRADHPAEAALPVVDEPRVERASDLVGLTFAASRERVQAAGGRTVLDVVEWSVRAPAGEPATWQRHAIADAVPLMPPW
jgi:hypothetical protein